MDANTRSKLFAQAQSGLFIAFAAAAIFARKPLLFASSSVTDVGYAFCAAGIVIMGCAFLSLRRVIQINPEPKAGGHLVTSGIYRILRHPIYTAIVMVVVGLWLRQPTLVLAIVTVVVVAFLLVKTRYEERLLAARYPEYSEYRRRSLGVIPGF